MKTFDNVLQDLNDNLIGKELPSISGKARPFSISELDFNERRYFINMGGKLKSRPFDELERIWQEMTSKPAVHVESFLGGSGSSRNQPETILANLPYVEWLVVDGKKNIAYIDEDNHEYGTIKQMDEDLASDYTEAMHSPRPRNPILDDYDQPDTDRLKGADNILLYGVPGAGKSHTIRTKYCNNDQRMEVIVFHPDYSNSDFVGQILPQANGEKVTYEFVPGPFTRILRKANDTPELYYYLVIEEINRGNAPAIFGEIFQLLDRNKDGESEYSINHPDIARVVYNGDSTRPIKIPSNLFILATMNTSDQNVFTLDTAFQRRWHMKIIANDIAAAEHADSPILDTGVTWKTFCLRINSLILDSNVGMTSSEDKRLGAYFVRPRDIELMDGHSDEAEEHNRFFAEKVLKYLWDDAFKFRRDALFDPKYRSLEQVLVDFQSKKRFSRFSVFKKGTFTAKDTSLTVNEEPDDTAVDNTNDDPTIGLTATAEKE
ncbi:MAG: AAA family ATPase [Clostridia bacterium]|nr:AAA family ATPase [Clostridia bacterium]